MFRDFEYNPPAPLFLNYYRQFTHVHIDVVTCINFIIVFQFFIDKVEFVELFIIIFYIFIFFYFRSILELNQAGKYHNVLHLKERKLKLPIKDNEITFFTNNTQQ